jgi:hypothetical protein
VTARALQWGLLNDHINHCVTAAARGSQAGADAQVAVTIRQVVLRGGVPPGLPCCVVEQAA